MGMDEVAYLWAKQERHRAGQGTNVFFEGKVIYSYGYHFPMACFYEWNGKRCILESSRRYSVSTARHQGCAGYAAHKTGLPAFSVTTPEPLTPPDKYLMEFITSANLVRERIRTAVVEVKQVREIKRTLESFFYWKRKVEEFAEFFDVDYELSLPPSETVLWADYAENRDQRQQRNRKASRRRCKERKLLERQRLLEEGQSLIDFTWQALAETPQMFFGDARRTIDSRMLGFAEHEGAYP